MAILLSITPEAEIGHIFSDYPPHLVVGVEEHPQWPGNGNLVFQVANTIRQEFLDAHADWLSRYLTLNDLFLLGPFVDLLTAEGYRLAFMPSCEPILADYARWIQPLDITGFSCPGEGELYGFQTFGLRRALERAEAQSPSERLFFINYAAGSGKSLMATAGSQELLNRGTVDLVLAVTTAPLKINLLRFFQDTTNLDATMVEGSPAKRQKMYREDHQVFVLNYDRFRFDLASIGPLARGKRVLFIFDEVQQILTEKDRTRTRKCINRVIEDCDPTIWAMSASVVRASPLRFRDVFNLDGNPRNNPLGTRVAFERRYVLSRSYFRVPTKRYGGSIEIEKITWDQPRLHEVRHRVSDRTHAIRKTDPAIRDAFKGMTSVITPVQLSHEDGRLYDMVLARAKSARDNGEVGLAQYFQVLRHVVNNPLALLRTKIEFGRELAAAHPNLITSAHCVKLRMLVDQLEAIRDAGDKCVVFTQWVHTSLELIADELSRRDISHVTHHGQMSRSAAQAAQDQFRTDPDITVFLSSDAGAFGLNLPEARYVISYEPTFSWDILMQRSERINRADSTLEGLTAYTLCTDDTIETRIAAVCEERRVLAANTLGTTETLNTSDEPADMAWLIFG